MARSTMHRAGTPPDPPSIPAGLRRPSAVAAMGTVLVVAAALALLSSLGHLIFDEARRGLDQPGGADLSVDLGVIAYFRFAELGKALVIAAGIAFWYGIRRGARWTWAATGFLMAGCAVAACAAGVYDGVWLAGYFLIAALASAADAIFGGDGGLGDGPLSVGIGVVIADVLLCGMALAGVVTVLVHAAIDGRSPPAGGR